MTEFTSSPEATNEQDKAVIRGDNMVWKLFTDGSSNENGSRAGLIMESPEKHNITSVVRFGFKALNNEKKYEALLARLKLVLHLKAEVISIYYNSQSVVNQVNGEYVTRNEQIASYLKKIQG